MVVFPSGNVVAQSSCQDGNGWLWFEIAPSMPTDKMEFPLHMKDDLKVYKLCINGNVFESDISGGDFEISGLGSGIVTLKSHAVIKTMSLYVIEPTATPEITSTLLVTATSTMTATSIATATTIVTETPIATATSVATTTETLPATKPTDPLLVGISIAVAAIITILIAVIAYYQTKKKRR